MKRQWTETRAFSRNVDDLIAERKLLQEDVELFKKELITNPEKGDVIPGTGGIRKIRLKSANTGKRGGFRACYLDDPKREELFLLKIYGKNEQEDLSSTEKKALKAFVDLIKGR